MNSQPLPIPVDNLVTYKSLTRLPWGQNGSSTPGTGDMDFLVKVLSTECQKNQQMMNTITQFQKNLDCSLQQKTKSKKEAQISRERSYKYSRRSRRPQRKKSKKKTSSDSSSEGSSSSSESDSSSSTYSCKSSKPKPVST